MHSHISGKKLAYKIKAIAKFNINNLLDLYLTLKRDQLHNIHLKPS